jgi:hypothetical protein
VPSEGQADREKEGVMLDAVTGKPIKLRVYGDGEDAFIQLPASQTEAVSRLFTEHSIAHWIAHLILSFDGKPPVGKIHLERKSDFGRAQELLDSTT